MLLVVGHLASLLSTPFGRDVLSDHEHLRYRDVWIFLKHIGFGVVLEVTEIPPMRGCSLKNGLKLAKKITPFKLNKRCFQFASKLLNVSCNS